jgi:lysozyme family protein
MDDFKKALAHVLKDEAGYVNHPADRGKETFRGVSRRTWKDWPGWALIDRTKAQGLTNARSIDREFANDEEMEALVEDFYRVNFWEKPAKWLTGRVLEKVFNTAVNIGDIPAMRLLQTVLGGLAVDGIPGPKTAAAASKVPADTLLTAYCQAQADYYRAIVKRDPSQGVFLKGWLRRAAWVPPREEA